MNSSTGYLSPDSAQRSHLIWQISVRPAIKRGIFGARSFTVGDELFWGNDRLEDALAWAKR